MFDWKALARTLLQTLLPQVVKLVLDNLARQQGQQPGGVLQLHAPAGPYEIQQAIDDAVRQIVG